MGIVDEALGGSPKKVSIVDEALAQDTPGPSMAGQRTAENRRPSLMRAIGNIPADIPRTAKGAWELASHPIKSAEGAIEGVGNLALSLTDPKTLQSLKEKAAHPLRTYNRAMDAIGREIEERPVKTMAGFVVPEVLGAGGRILGELAPDFSLVSKPGEVSKINEGIRSATKKGMQKGIRPSVASGHNAAQVAKYYKNADSAVQSIVEHSKGKLPESVEEFSWAIKETKEQVYGKYSTMARQAGQEGAMIDLNPIIEDMRKVGSSAEVRRVNSTEGNRLLKMADEWKHHPTSITPTEAENMIASLNAQVKSFWKNPNFNDTVQAVNTERISRLLRRATDESIEAYQGLGYQELKKEYGSLSAIEKDVTHRATVDARKDAGGFFHLADIAAAGEFTRGLAKMDPSLMTSAVAIKGMKGYIQMLNDPNRIVKNMFRKTGKLMEKKSSMRGGISFGTEDIYMPSLRGPL
jgi:hypothetical protein